MKKILALLSLGALIALLSACSGKPSVSVKEASTVKAAKTVELAADKPLDVAIDGTSYHMKKTTFTEDGEALIYVGIEEGTPETPSPEVPEEPEIKLIVKPFTAETFTKATGFVYNVSGVGKFEIIGNTIQFTPAGSSSSITVNGATVKDIVAGSALIANMSRSWTVSSSIISVKGAALGSAGIQKKIDGTLDLLEFANWAEGLNKGISFSDKDKKELSGYRVKNIIITGDNTFVIKFTEKYPFYGKWNLSGSTFSYDLGDLGNAIINGKATGTFTFPADNTALLDVKATITAGGTTYEGRLELTLKAK